MDNKSALEGKIAELDGLHGELLDVTKNLSQLADRADVIIKHAKRKMPLKDEEFAPDFENITAKIRILVDKSDGFWKSAGDLLRDLPKSGYTEQAVPMRSFASRAKIMGKSMEEFVSVLHFVQDRCRNMPFKLNWGFLELAAEDLSRINAKISFVVREFSKIAEASYLSGRENTQS